MTNLSRQGNMFTEATFGENVGEIKEELSGIDFGIGNLSVSSTPHESSHVGTDGSSVTVAKSNVSGADLILSAFDSINISECLERRVGVATDIIKADAFDSIGQANLSGQSPGEGKDTSQFDSLPSTDELSAQRDGRGEVFLGTDKTCKPNPPLIVYTSSRRSAHNTKVNQNNESQKTSKYRRMALKNSAIDLSSMQILRKSRSSFSKRARSSVWGYLGNILPDFGENSGLDQSLGDEKKLRKVRRGKGKRDSLRDQPGLESVGKRCTPTGKISLKIKIGNKICTMGNAAENLSAPGKDIPELFDTMENKLREKVPGVLASPYKRNLEKVMSLDASALGTHLDVGGAFDDPSLISTSDFHRIISPEDGRNLGGSIENLCSDAGTSPDSEVINPVPDAPLCEKVLPDMQDSPIMSKASVCPSDTSCLVLSPKKSKKGNKKGNLHQVGKESNLTETSNNAKVPISKGDVSSLSISLTKSKKGKKKDKLHQVGDCSAESQRIAAETIYDAKVPADLEVGQNMDHTMVTTSIQHLNHAEINPCSGLVAATVSSNPQVSETLIPCSNGQKFTECSRAKGGIKGRSRIFNIPKKKDKASKKRRNKNNVGGEHQPDEMGGASGAHGGVESCQAAGNQTSSDLGESGALSTDLIRPISLQLSSGGLEEQYMPLRNAWVLCDECQKWRRIPAALADQIEETNCRWTCKDNTDEDFADCSIPQEKSNSEINEELEISDEEDACGTFLKSNRNQPKVSQKSSWSLIKSNLFLHRSRKTQTIDEVMVCHCKPPSDGRMGCGAKCLNRMLNIECVQGTCPCGELCSNQQFQKRKYAKLKWFRCGKKGYGLQALKNISQGQFIIEYVGEVLDVQTYEARQREYALNGHKHFYFMTLNGSEVIDACAKGNLGRFINHSCDPNCRTEKWMVNGEVCVGLFSLRDIKKGEEVTFNYNYVRVFGAAAKKCVCGSPNCQGYIGGDPASSEVIVQDDSDDEFSEPIMTCDDRELNEDWRDIMSNSLIDGENKTANEPPENRYNMKRLMSDGESITESHIPEYLTQKVEGVGSAPAAETIGGDKCGVGNFVGNNFAEQMNIGKINCEFSSGPQGLQSQMHSSPKLMDVSLQTDGILSKATPSVLESAVNAASPSKSLSDTIESKRKLKYAVMEGRGELAKSNSTAKTKRSSSSVKNGKPKTNVMNDKGTTDVDKLNTVLHKPKKLPELTLNNHFEAVEEKLNELLDPDGGISKRKDASRGYLKLLFLTAASGNNGHGEAIQSSNRDLSMILDALLKTKSRTVLVDIINKNGLQMLHNIMKRYRKDFIKTPILRKLLKVLEHLALREILTLEHITGGPPCAGVESFKDSILILTEHADRQVHQIARNFRDRWIPRSLRKNFCMERDDGRSEFNQCSGRVGLPVSNDHWNDRGGNPSEVINSSERQSVSVCGMGETSTPDLPLISGGSNGTDGTKTRKRKSRWDNPVEDHQLSRTRTNLTGDEQLNIDEDIPPGFSSPCKGPLVPSDTPSIAIHRQDIQMHIKQRSCDIILGDSQLRFVGRVPLSYGVPYSVMQQFGVLKAETSESWNIAPGVPFHPFPPLPPYARGETRDLSTSTSCASLSEHAEKAEQSSTCVSHHTSQKHTRTCSLGAPENNSSVANRQPDFQQGVSCGLGRRYFRQQKWNHSKLAPPWVRMRNGWGHAGNNMRNDSPGVSLGNGANEFRNLYNSQEVNWRG